MSDISKQHYAKWLEESLKGLVKFSPKKIAIVAINEKSGSFVSHNFCTAGNLFEMAGLLHMQGTAEMLHDNKDLAQYISGEEE